MVGHLVLKDGTVLRHVKHGNLIANALVLCLRRKDPLSEGSHVVIGLCWARERALCSAERHVVCSIQSCSNGNEETARSRTELTYNCIYECKHDWKVDMSHTFTQTRTFHISRTGFSPCIKYRTGSATWTPTFRNLMHTEEDHIQTHMATLKPCFYAEDSYLLIKFCYDFENPKSFPGKWNEDRVPKLQIPGADQEMLTNRCMTPIHVNILHHHYHIVPCSQHLRATAFNSKTKTPMRQIQLERLFYSTNSLLTLLTWLYPKK